MLRKKLFTIPFALICAVLILFSIGCRKKDVFDTSPSATLVFSSRVVRFDTVFTTVGSATHNFTAKNPGKKSVNISHIMLQGGSASYFRINIDGRSTTDFQNHELAAGDSIYIFAEVTIDPNAANLPFIVTDTIIFIVNGHTQKVALQAFGKNAHFIKNRVLGCDTVWQNDGKPIVLYDTAYVKKGCSLTIEKGVTVYCHPKSILIIGGTLACNGTKDEPVIFREDRLEHKYDNEPGQWYGIVLLSYSDTSSMTHTILENGSVGLEADSLAHDHPNSAKLTLNKCIIKNMSSTALAGFGSSINAVNTLIFSSGLYNFLTDLGGYYNFTHCTFDNFDNVVTNRQASIQIESHIYKNKDSSAFPIPVNTAFRNCIIWGSLDDEVRIVKHLGNTGNILNNIFYHCVVKAKKVGFSTTNIVNKDPLFINSYGGDFHIDAFSSAVNQGVTYPLIPVVDDLDDVIRKTANDTIPDIGSYEYKN
jgi:hypothetical protein